MYYQNKNSSLGWSIALVILVAVLAIGAIVALLPETDGGIKDQINDTIDKVVNGGSETKDPDGTTKEPDETTKDPSEGDVVGGNATCAHEWDDGEVTKAATCSTAGVKTFTCIKDGCGSKSTAPIPATGHNYVDDHVSKKATCTTVGTKVQKCNNCQGTNYVPIPATGHDYVDDHISEEPTCITDGTKVQKCNNCQGTKDVPIPAMGHKYGSWETVTAATCKTNGLKKRVCKICDDEVTEVITMLDHTYVDRYVSNGDGTHTLVCSACGGGAFKTSSCVPGSTASYVNDTSHSYICLHCSGTVLTSHSKQPNTAGDLWCPSCGHVFD